MARFGTLRSRFALILGASTLLVLPGPGAGAAVVRPAAGTGGDATWFERYNGPGSLDDDAAGLVVSPDASRVFVTGTSFGPAGSGDDYATFAYDALTGAKLWLSRYNGARTRYDYGNAIAISPDGATVFVTGASTESGQATSVTTVAYDAATGAQLWVSVSSHGKGSGEAVAVSPDGSSVFVTGQDYLNSDYVTIAYDGSTGAELWASTYNGPGSGTDEANAIGVSPDGSTVWVTGVSLGSGTSSDFATVAYDAASGSEQWVARYNGPVSGADEANAIGVNPSGTAVFVTGQSDGGGGVDDYATVAYNTGTGGELWVARYSGPGTEPDEANALGLSPDGTKVYVTGQSFGSGTLDDYATVAYDAVSGGQLWVSRYDASALYDFAHALAVAPDGSSVFVTGQSEAVQTGFDYATVAYDAVSGSQLWVARAGRKSGLDSAADVKVAPGGASLFVTGSLMWRNGAGTDYATIGYVP